MPITSVSEMRQINTQEWNDQQRGWYPLWTAIQNYGNAFFEQITFNVPIPSEGHTYWNFKINNANKPSTMGLKVSSTGKVYIHFSKGNLPNSEANKENIRREEFDQFKNKLIQFGFSQNPERNQWTRLPLSLNWDKKAKFSFGIDYPGGMTETERAKWQVKQLIALSQLVSELYQ